MHSPWSQHVPPYPGRQLQPRLWGVPPFWQVSRLQARVCRREKGHLPPQEAARVSRLVRVCVPLVPHWCEQELQLVQLLTRQSTVLQGGGAALRRRRLLFQKEFASIIKSRTQIIIKVLFIFNFRIDYMQWLLCLIASFPEGHIYSHRGLLMQNGRIYSTLSSTLRMNDKWPAWQLRSDQWAHSICWSLYTTISTCIFFPSSKVLDESVNHITKYSNNSEAFDLIVS